VGGVYQTQEISTIGGLLSDCCERQPFVFHSLGYFGEGDWGKLPYFHILKYDLKYLFVKFIEFQATREIWLNTNFISEKYLVISTKFSTF
jgi:hypothetical protein